MMVEKSKFNVADLFCGIGGFSKGFEKAGFNILFGLDNWDIALKTFKQNHINAEPLNRDIKEVADSFYKNYNGRIDVIIAGPPCQGFSMSGKRDINDKRNTLFEEVIRVVKIIRPKIVLIENVVGLLSMKNPDGRLVKEIIKEKLERIGYQTEYKVLNASDYGVPQSRKRVVFIGSKVGKIDFPEERKIKVTVGDALGNIPDNPEEKYTKAKTVFQKLMADGEKVIRNHEPMNHNKEVLSRIKHVPKGGNWQNIPKEIYNVGGEHSNNYRRLDPSKPSITLKHATKSMIIHPEFNRVVTAREVARLQSFSDSFVLEGTASEQHQQLANAVPPLLAFEIAKKIKQKLEGAKV
jgi:DNA (cytosine-5)-methyltransferase 1